MKKYYVYADIYKLATIMKIVNPILIICLFTTSVAWGQVANNFYDESGSVIMDKITVRQFIEELRISKEDIERESEIEREFGGILIHRLHTNGQQDTNWISELDVRYLMTLIDSKEPAKCVIRDISSNLKQPQKTTMGNQVILILHSYKEKLNYPHGFNICGENALSYKKEIVKWFNKRK